MGKSTLGASQWCAYRRAEFSAPSGALYVRPRRLANAFRHTRATIMVSAWSKSRPRVTLVNHSNPGMNAMKGRPSPASKPNASAPTTPPIKKAYFSELAPCEEETDGSATSRILRLEGNFTKGLQAIHRVGGTHTSFQPSMRTPPSGFTVLPGGTDTVRLTGEAASLT